jgi:ABC-type cobalamin transport system ATPase subunit
MTLLRLNDIARSGLAPVTLDVAAGSCCVIMGPSGAGKSLLLRAVADLDPHQGEAYLDGTACSAMSAPTGAVR